MAVATDQNPYLRILGSLHGSLVHRRRTVVLAEKLAEMLEPCRMLDVGCGDGTVAKLISEAVPGLEVRGAEYAPRPECSIPCVHFDGEHLPFEDKSFDGCMFVDVLHHTLDPLAILKEALRVSRQFILIKDHLSENFIDNSTLRFMDWLGNRPHNVVLPYAYLSMRQWKHLFDTLGLEVVQFEHNIPLYPAPFSLLFGRKLHFICLLARKASGTTSGD